MSILLLVALHCSSETFVSNECRLDMYVVDLFKQA